MVKPKQIRELPGKVLLVLTDLAINIDDAPDRLKDGELLSTAHLLVRLAGKVINVRRIPPFPSFTASKATLCSSLDT